MRGEDEAHRICGVPLELLLKQGHLSVFSIGTSLDDGTWRAKLLCTFCAESVVHEHIRTTSSCTVWFAHIYVHKLIDDILQHGITTVDGVHCSRRWLTVTVCEVVTMETMFLFRKQQSLKNVEGMLLTHM